VSSEAPVPRISTWSTTGFTPRTDLCRPWKPRRIDIGVREALLDHGLAQFLCLRVPSRIAQSTEGQNVVMTALIETSSDRWTRMIRGTGVVGLVTFVVLFAAIIAMSQGEPTFLASPEEALAFYLNSTAGWVEAANAVAGLAAIGWIWFVVGLCLLLTRAEGSPPWRSAVALVCGVILAALLLLNTSGNAASFGATDLDLAVASYAFDVSSLGLANVWLAMGGFAVCCGWVVVSTRVVGRWLGWWGIASGLGLVLARFFWTSEIWLLPYAAFWIWMIIMCVQLVRKPRAVLKAADGRASPSGARP
jgi:hypothetical protein